MLYDSRKDTTIAAVLIRARSSITDEKNFCQSGWGYHGRKCAVHAIFDAAAVPDNVCWEKVPAVCFLVQLCKVPLHDFNDRHTHREMLALFDRGIVEAGKMEMY
jgi:hypothetical protein